MRTSAGKKRKKYSQLTPLPRAVAAKKAARAPWVTRFKRRKGRQDFLREYPKAASTAPSMRRVGRKVARNCRTYPKAAGGAETVPAVKSTVTED